MIQAKVEGTRLIAAGFRNASGVLKDDEKRIVRKWSQLLLTKIQGNASGRPGPNAPTGDYRRSWGIQHFDTIREVSALVGTNAPQGLRLELGFTGVDSLGREYDQQPYPHVGPAADYIEPKFLAEYERSIPK